MNYIGILRKYLKDTTDRGYKRIIKVFFDYLDRENLSLLDLDPMHYRRFLFDYSGIKSQERLRIYLEDINELMDWFVSENIEGADKQKFILGLEELSFDYLKQFIVEGGQYICKEDIDNIISIVDRYSGFTSLMIVLSFNGVHGFAGIGNIKIEDIEFPRIGSVNRPFTIRVEGENLKVDGSAIKFIDHVLCGANNEIDVGDPESGELNSQRLYRRSSHIFPFPHVLNRNMRGTFLGSVYSTEMKKCGFDRYKIGSFFYSGILYQISRKYDIDLFLRQVFYGASGKAAVLKYENIEHMLTDRGIKVNRLSFINFIKNKM